MTEEEAEKMAKEFKKENPHILMQEFHSKERNGYHLLEICDSEREARERAEEIADKRSEPGAFPAKNPNTGEYEDYKEPPVLILKPVARAETRTVTKEMQKKEFEG